MDPVTVIGFVASAQQLSGLAFEVASSLHRYLQRIKNDPKLSKELQEEIACTASLLVDLRIALETGWNDAQSFQIESLQDYLVSGRKILEIITERLAIREGGKGFLARPEWPFNEKENKELLLGMAKHREALSLMLQVYHAAHEGKFLIFSFKQGQKSGPKFWNGSFKAPPI
jgi:hypothetical protein